MNKQRKKLTLNKETLQDLSTLNAGLVKGGFELHYTGYSGNQRICTRTCYVAICPPRKTHNKKCMR